MLLVMDPPQHTAYRRPLTPHFSTRVIGRMEQRIRTRCHDLLGAAADKGEADFCHDVAGPLTSETIAEIMGLPHEDTALIRQWAEVALGSQDQALVDSYPGDASTDMIAYAIAWAARRRALPRQEDVTSLLLESTFDDGEPMTDLEFGVFFFQLVTAGNDTTSTLISSGTEQLHPPPRSEAGPAGPPRADRPPPSRRCCGFATPSTTYDGPQPVTPIWPIRTSRRARRWRSTSPPPTGTRRYSPTPELRHPSVTQPSRQLRHRLALLPRRAGRPAAGAGVLRGVALRFPTVELSGFPRAGAIQSDQRLPPDADRSRSMIGATMA